MAVKNIQQSDPAGAVAPPVPAEDPVEYPSEDGLPMATSLAHGEGLDPQDEGSGSSAC